MHLIATLHDTILFSDLFFHSFLQDNETAESWMIRRRQAFSVASSNGNEGILLSAETLFFDHHVIFNEAFSVPQLLFSAVYASKPLTL